MEVKGEGQVKVKSEGKEAGNGSVIASKVLTLFEGAMIMATGQPGSQSSWLKDANADDQKNLTVGGCRQ